MTIAIEMVVPGLLGWWIDSYLNTKVAFMILGFLAGMALGFWHLLRLASGDSTQRFTTRPKDDDSP